MRRQILSSALLAIVLVIPRVTAGQQLSALRAGVALSRVKLDAPLAPLAHAQVSTDEAPARWPFVLGGALIGGVAAGAWYAYEVSKNDDPMIDLSVPVVGIGIAAGALTGLIVSQVVRGPD